MFLVQLFIFLFLVHSCAWLFIRLWKHSSDMILFILSKIQILFIGLYMCYLNSQFVFELPASLSIYLDIEWVVHLYMELFPKQSLVNVCWACSVFRPRKNKFPQAFYRHRRFWIPLLLQRGGPSHTRVAATATFSSPMSTNRPPNSFVFSKISLLI